MIRERIIAMKHRKPDDMKKIITFINSYRRDNHQSPSARQISKGTGIPRTTLQRMMRTMAENDQIYYDGETVETDFTVIDNEETVSTGIIGDVQCGSFTLEEESVREIVQLPVSLFGKGDLFILEAHRDSMTGVGIEEGDLVVIRRQEEAHSGQIVVAYVEGEGNTLKTYKEKNGIAYLHPENPKYDDIPITDCKIQGIAISVIKKLEET